MRGAETQYAVIHSTAIRSISYTTDRSMSILPRVSPGLRKRHLQRSASSLSPATYPRTRMLRRARRYRQMRSYNDSMVLYPCLLTFLPTQRKLAMNIKRLSLFVLYLGPSHPFGSCSRLVPDGCALDLPDRILPGICSEQGPKSSACAVTRRPHGKYVVRSFRFLGKGVSTDLQA